MLRRFQSFCSRNNEPAIDQTLQRKLQKATDWQHTYTHSYIMTPLKCRLLVSRLSFQPGRHQYQPKLLTELSLISQWHPTASKSTRCWPTHCHWHLFRTGTLPSSFAAYTTLRPSFSLLYWHRLHLAFLSWTWRKTYLEQTLIWETSSHKLTKPGELHSEHCHVTHLPSRTHW